MSFLHYYRHILFANSNPTLPIVWYSYRVPLSWWDDTSKSDLKVLRQNIRDTNLRLIIHQMTWTWRMTLIGFFENFGIFKIFIFENFGIIYSFSFGNRDFISTFAPNKIRKTMAERIFRRKIYEQMLSWKQVLLHHRANITMK